MIRRILPYPILFLALLAMWLLLQQSLAFGQVVLGVLVAYAATHAMSALQPERPKIGNYRKIAVLFFRVTVDIVVSNFAVTRIILIGERRKPNAGFLTVPLELTDRVGLALLACIVTATPGSAWLEYDAARSTVLIHVLDMENDQEWIETLKSRYESLLLEIFQ